MFSARSPTSFVNNKTATTLQNTVKEARRIQLGQDDEANRMVCYNGFKTLSFGRMITPIEYSQLKLDEKIRTQCNFSIIGGQATGTYQFQTGFYGLTDMPAEFQKAIDLTLNKEKVTFAFVDDILIISHGTKDQHIEKSKTVLDKLGRENVAISEKK